MRAVDRTTKKFMATVRDAMPWATMRVSRSVTGFGRSNYVYIDDGLRFRAIKVRISDHPVGMRRARMREEDLYIAAGADPSSWSVWVGEMRRMSIERATCSTDSST